MSSKRRQDELELKARRAPRVSPRAHPTIPGHVNFRAGEVEGAGLILDVSSTGAHVFEASHRLEPGTKVELSFLQPSSSRRMNASCEVVRKTGSGFAVKFLRLERELEQLVLAATAKPPKE